MSAVLDPERPYTPYQRRQVIKQLSSKFDCDIFKATEKFAAMELENVEGLKKICDKFDKAPPKNNMEPPKEDA